MIIRFVVKNLFSFNEETEFNLFPNRTQRLTHHKKTYNGIDVLRLSAIYGANGSGKSNLIKSIFLLQTMIEDGSIPKKLSNFKFKLSNQSKKLPISMAIEFFYKESIYYYTLTFDENVILNEELYYSELKEDKLIFRRDIIEGKQEIVIDENSTKDEKSKLFIEILEEKLIQPNELLITFLSTKYKDEYRDVRTAYEWFTDSLVVLQANATPSGITRILDRDENLMKFSLSFISSLNTGISHMEVVKEKLSDFFDDTDLKTDIVNTISEDFKKESDVTPILRNNLTGEEITVFKEDNDLYIKRLKTFHKNIHDELIDFELGLESDGTKRLIDYLPAFNGILNEERTFIIDEIERSIHPITIKEIIKKISLDENVKGQIIFTTHESCLLDQDILRTDEIWFAQKTIDGSSKLFSLSDFNIHNTASIQNGYLNGRYGGIPFLSNLKDLNWHKYDISEQE